MDYSKKVFICLALLTVCLGATAQEFGDSRYAVGAKLSYGYNTTWGHHAGEGVNAFLPLHKNISVIAELQHLTSGVISGTVTARPQFKVGSGEIFCDLSLHFRPFLAYSNLDFLYAASLGYRRDYLSVQLGAYNKTTFYTGADKAQQKNKVSENFMAIYNVRLFVRPSGSNWNLAAGVTNYTPYGYERPHFINFLAEAFYRFNNHWEINAQLFYKPAGIFHQVVSAYGISTNAGFKYIF